MVRGHAAWALGRLGGARRAARAAFSRALDAESEPEIRQEIRCALEMVDEREEGI